MRLTYLFEFEDGSWKYELCFDNVHRFIPRDGGEPKGWTKLSFHQCPHCPLDPSNVKECPVARNLDRVVEDSRSTASYLRATVTVHDEARTYMKQCDTQDGLRSLFGVIMASSGCPHLDWLRPLARFHLPFADIEETFFRVLSLQFVELFFSGEELTPAEGVKKLEQRYKAVEQVNHAFVERIGSYCEADADNNAIAALDVFVQLFPYQLKTNFESLRKYFERD